MTLPDLLLRDPTFWTYIGIVIVALYGISLFLWWWKKVGHASEVYIYFILLLASETFYNLFNAISRYLLLNDDDRADYFEFLNTGLWEIRAIIHLGVLTLIIARMTMRVIQSSKGDEL